MSLSLSQKAQNLHPSATLAVGALAKEMKRAGKPVISFSMGEPDFTSPKAVLDAGHNAIDKGYTHYTASTGIAELREAVCAYYKKHFNLEYAPTDVVVGSGAKPVLYCAMAAILDEGDEVIVPTPAWVSYVEQIRLCGGKEVLVECADTDNVPSLERMKAAITPKTKCILLNSPNNPTGAVYDAETMKGIAQLALDHDLIIVNDEIYERLVYGNAKFNEIVALCPAVKDRTIIVNGVSKAFAMTGWRIGYALGPTKYIKAMGSIQGHLTSNPCSISQYAALGGLKNADDTDVETMRQAFSKRRELVFSLLDKIPGISYTRPNGAFYVLINLKGLLGKSHNGTVLADDAALCSDLLKTKYVAATPGSAFFADGTMRIAYANSEEDIREGLRRFAEYVSEIK
ncbi:MAG: pyridoxal phosphate-dependent aminotransferase [Pyramidobacter sp.]|jgi:aspartate aminotransferase